MSNKQYPSSALANQSVIEVNPQAVYPPKGKITTTPTIIITMTNKPPRLIEDREDAIELTLTIALLGAIIIGFLLVVELMYPGWSIPSLMEVTNG